MAARQTGPQQRPHLEVHLDAAELGSRMQVGRLYPADARADLAPSFEYTREWLASNRSFLLDPRLDLYAGEQHAPHPRGFGIFLDSAPDRWGRVLMERREAIDAKKEKRPMRRLTELDFMLGVHDVTRSGALRFRRGPDEAFLDDHALPAPPIADLRALATVARKLEAPGAEALPEYENWLSMLIAPGTSMGGARPKATFTQHDGRLWLAKFPAPDDRHDSGSWEHLTHRLAHQAGIWVPASDRLALGGRHHTFCVQRFDRGVGRDSHARRMVASAMTLLERTDGDTNASYLDLVDFIDTQGGTGLIDDLQQLFRRAVFNLLVGNRDDHLRNHSFVRVPTGWRLSQAFDMNPNRDKRQHVLTWDGRTAEPDLEALIKTAPFYRLEPRATQTLVNEVKKVVKTWRTKAKAMQLPAVQVQAMEGVFAV